MENSSQPLDTTMIKIDGAKVRRLREAKGLTQLYVATIVEVTTDTVSRWENRRYQTIKRGNAIKLAQALETDIEAILDTNSESEAAQDQEPKPQPATRTAARPPFFLQPGGVVALILLLLATGALVLWHQNNNTSPQPPMDLKVSRLLPEHCAPGQIFPVLLTVDNTHAVPQSVIIKETLPPGCQPLFSQPPFTSYDAQKQELKWLQKITGTGTTIFYIARSPAGPADGHTVAITGVVTQKGKSSRPITGQGKGLAILPFHWADSNVDNTIDDDEILAVYESFNAYEETALDLDFIESVWSGNGYRWDAAQQQFIILP